MSLLVDRRGAGPSPRLRTRRPGIDTAPSLTCGPTGTVTARSLP